MGLLKKLGDIADHPFTIPGLVFIMALLGGAYLSDRHEGRKASIRADINRDGVTSRDEWGAVYKELGIQYNEVNPRELTLGELEKYNSLHTSSNNI
jgi:hypothetical protein